MKATPEREPSARAVVLGLLAMAMTTGLACLVPIFAMYRGGSRADTIAFLVGAWLSTSTLVGLTGGLTLRFKPTLVILKSLCVAGFLGALNGSIVVTLMLAQRAADPYLGAAVSVAAMVGGVLGLIVGLFVQLPLHDGVSESPTHVLVRVSSLETGPFRDAPARVPYAWVDW